MRHMNKLTFQDLFNWGIRSVNWNEKTGTYEIIRLWKRRVKGGYTDKPKLSKLHPIKVFSKRKYAPDGEGMMVGISVNCEMHNITLGRLVYAWFKGEVPENFGVCSKRKGEKDEYKLENLYILPKHILESEKQKGNQYFSEKWNIAKKGE